MTPFEGRGRTLDGNGWVVTLEHGGLLGENTTLRAAWQSFDVDFGNCMQDVWSLCGEDRFRRLALGIALVQ